VKAAVGESVWRRNVERENESGDQNNEMWRRNQWRMAAAIKPAKMKGGMAAASSAYHGGSESEWQRNKGVAIIWRRINNGESVKAEAKKIIMAEIAAKANESMWRNVNEMAKKIIANGVENKRNGESEEMKRSRKWRNGGGAASASAAA
jgi:hypothetical protein